MTVDSDHLPKGDLRLLVIGAATAVDTALKQDARGISAGDLVDLS